jgi:hypothetical protein
MSESVLAPLPQDDRYYALESARLREKVASARSMADSEDAANRRRSIIDDIWGAVRLSIARCSSH